MRGAVARHHATNDRRWAGGRGGPPSAEVAALATQMTERSDWPSVDNGYRMDDQTFYATTTYDLQSHFDRFGGLYYEALSVRTGTRIR
jgi:hypothetical protein